MTNTTFRVTKIDTDIFYINEYLGVDKDIDIYFIYKGLKSTIQYKIDFELRGYGIKDVNFELHIDSSDLTISEIEKLVLNGWEEERSELNYQFIGSYPENKFELKNEAKFKEDGSFYFDNVSIDFKKKTIELS